MYPIPNSVPPSSAPLSNGCTSVSGQVSPQAHPLLECAKKYIGKLGYVTTGIQYVMPDIVDGNIGE
jgi:hypothetical protein